MNDQKKIPLGSYPFIDCKAGCHSNICGGNTYKWCRLENNGTLTFGEEENNYAGGESISMNWLVGTLPDGSIKIFDASKGCPPPTEMYRAHVIHNLIYLWRYEKDYFNNIVTMLADNNATEWLQIVNDEVIKGPRK